MAPPSGRYPLGGTGELTNRPANRGEARKKPHSQLLRSNPDRLARALIRTPRSASRSAGGFAPPLSFGSRAGYGSFGERSQHADGKPRACTIVNPRTLCFVRFPGPTCRRPLSLLQGEVDRMRLLKAIRRKGCSMACLFVAVPKRILSLRPASSSPEGRASPPLSDAPMGGVEERARATQPIKKGLESSSLRLHGSLSSLSRAIKSCERVDPSLRYLPP